MTVLAGARVVTPTGVLDPGFVRIDQGLITEVGAGTPTGVEVHDVVVDLGGGVVVPGFIDLHVHGGGGHTVTTGDPAEAAEAVAFHRRHGTTTSLLSLVTAPVDMLVGAVERLATLVEADRCADGSPGSLAGVHLEGPFLSTDACGAQDPQWMQDPDPGSIDALVEAGRGTVQMVTLAPELSGGLAAVERLVEWGVVVAVGHTRADHETAAAAFDAGATVATHLFNCMGAFHHRDPGTVGAALADDRVTAELILDGHHVHDDTARIAMGAKGSSRVALITDAIALAGAGDGVIDLGSARVEVADGIARLSSDGALAGSTLTMDVAFRNAVALGATVAEASEMASAVPARVLGLDGTRGTIEEGRHADLVVLADDLTVRDVYVGGTLVA
ncbi:MAG: N-acetylglucosamine-6-phosphate deacetylase [Actinobacteria bacterium]|nr:N-acetylglucosamine-6-phosphate deacetylase [Actinomycetota bacterium]